MFLSSEQLVFEAFLRYYDLLSHAEMLTDLKSKKLRKSIGLAKQKLIFYLSFIKENKAVFESGLGCREFVAVFVNERIYQRLNREEMGKMRDAIKGSKYFKIEEK